ncbi:fimbrial chaperone [unidentified bacterial endosymbiont]|uniref:fimbrial chaperone n=1 Tax=unidentified bacterial endosymbiont TaxID=2355 RepID=UPI00209E3237|nr:fimbrial chaperone [unidentified bacterial endosymbiont]
MHAFTVHKNIIAMTLASALLCPAVSYADIVLSGTRVIYPQESKDVVINLNNRGNMPLLVQSWIDDGRDTTNPQELKVPFVVTPPVSRVDPSKGQTLRITYMGQPLPKDRESLFWLNVLEVPPKSANAADKNLLQLAFRTRVKVLFRPQGLKGEPTDAVKQLQWSLKKEGNKVIAIAKNNQAWNVSISEGNVISNNKHYSIDVKTVAPYSTQEMAVKGLTSLITGKVNFKAINDYGGPVEQISRIN